MASAVQPSSSEWQECEVRLELDTAFRYTVFSGRIETSDLDDREYRLVKLENGLHAILVHDPAAEKAAACVTIQVGAMHDPYDVQGLAHFCEHMLSKGSELFPEENDFLSFISSNGGMRNASTGSSHATYWFSIGSEYLSGALARTAAFFHCPLFTQSLTKREIYAVDSEYKRNIQNDARRILQINRTLSVPGHPLSKFSTGNVESITMAARNMQKDGNLSSAEGASEDSDDSSVWNEIRRRLVEWWQREYCASRITLAVIGKESLDDLTLMMLPMFSPILNRGLDPRPVFTQSVWGPNEMGSIVFIKTVKDYYGLTLTFVLPDQRPHYKSQPTSILTHFLGHEGPGSVFAYLKKKGWLVSISAASMSGNPSVYQLKVSAELTKDGYVHYKDVLLTIFNYLSLLRSSPLDPYHFEEMSTMSKIRFRFKEKLQPHTYANWLSYELSEPYPPEWILSGGPVIREWDEALVRDMLALCTADKGRVTLEAKNHPDEIVGEGTQWAREKWLGGEYCVQRLEPLLMEKAQALNDNTDLFLPRPNPFIPTNLTVERDQVSEPAKLPQCLRRSSLSTLWFKKDDQFCVPKAYIRLHIKSPLAYGTPRQAVMTTLLVELVDDALTEVTYDASLAGLNYSISQGTKGILVSLGGYSDKLPALLQTVLQMLRNIEPDPERLRVVAEQVQRKYENFPLGQPSNLSEHFATWAFLQTIWTPSDKLAELPFVTVDDIQKHKDDLLAKVHVEALVHGNVEAERAVQLIESVEQCLSARPLLESEHPLDRSLIIPSGSNIILRKIHANAQEGNSGISYYCQFGEVADASLRPVLELIAHIIKEPTFSQLRTREQLGYVVSASLWISSTSMGLGIKVQSTRPPWYVEARIDAFLSSYRDQLEHIPLSDFDAKKDGLIIRKLERAKNLAEENARFWGYVSSGYCDFLRHEIDAEAIRALTLVEVLTAYDAFVLPTSESASRKKLSVHLVSQQMTEAAPAQGEGAIIIGDADDAELARFKAGLACYPAAVPIPMIYAGFEGMRSGDESSGGTSRL